MPTIRTNMWLKPVPTAAFDWAAWYDSIGEEGPTGYGATKEAAVANLLDEHPPDCLDCRGTGGLFPGVECATCEGSGERCEGDIHDPIVIL